MSCWFLFFTDMQKAEALGCEKLSKTWSGQCLSSKGCNKQCINKEKAIFGACRWDWFSTDCYCYFCWSRIIIWYSIKMNNMYVKNKNSILVYVLLLMIPIIRIWSLMGGNDVHVFYMYCFINNMALDKNLFIHASTTHINIKPLLFT